jgi:hypothetical protein
MNRSCTIYDAEGSTESNLNIAVSLREASERVRARPLTTADPAPSYAILTTRLVFHDDVEHCIESLTRRQRRTLIQIKGRVCLARSRLQRR